ncbi:MAG: YjbH domain-containing protein, partial [Rhodoferax sp.]
LRLRQLCVFGIVFLHANLAHAMGQGVASIGATGGLHIPSAYVLASGEAALSMGNYQDPLLGSFDRQRNYTLGFGMLPGIELFGRLAEYTQNIGAPPGLPDFSGIRDISANIKWQVPLEYAGSPKLALGATDMGGGAVNFKSAYAVASDEWGPVRWSLGYAHGTPALGQSDGVKVLDGTFGGVEVLLSDTRAALLLESTGSASHAGLRYYTEPIALLGDAQVVGTVQRSLDVTDTLGRRADATSFNLSLVLPLETDHRSRNRQASAVRAQTPLPEVAPGQPLDDAVPRLVQALQASGLDRVRIGLQGAQLVVEYENYRYLTNEADALGLVLGVAAELAPRGVQTIHARALKTGLAVQEVSVALEAWRQYLRWGDAQAALSSLSFDPLPEADLARLQWLDGSDQALARVRLAFSPLLNYTVGTEYGLFDYSLALQMRASTPLWRGAIAYADLVQRLDSSENMQPGRIFDMSLHQNGVKTAALQQSLWLAPRWFASVGVGRHQYQDSISAEGETLLLLPWRNDSVHLRGRSGGGATGSYRWQASPATWVDAAFNQYTDGARGPSLALTRWFGDVALQLLASTDATNTFVGLQISLPIAPRQGMASGALQASASPRFTMGLRTLLTNATNTGNWVRPDALRAVDLSYNPQTELLNSGRSSPDFWRTQLVRMREAFYLYGRNLLP